MLEVLGTLEMDVALGILGTTPGILNAGRYERALVEGNTPGTGPPSTLVDVMGVQSVNVSDGEVAAAKVADWQCSANDAALGR